MTEVNTKFAEFIKDEQAFDMFITGVAGTGKTTSLAELVQVCVDLKIPAVVCAYTHKACMVLKAKLPSQADVRTLHKFLRKRPGINTNATHKAHLNITTQFGEPEKIRLLFVDEFSMVGEKDVMSIGELQDPNYTGTPEMKVVYIGDPNQLPPVKDAQTLYPSGKYVVKLTKVHRQSEGNPLLDTLADINEMLETGEVKKLAPNKAFKRNITDLIGHYLTNKEEDKVILAYTNKRVQEINELIHQRKLTEYRWNGQYRLKVKLLSHIETDEVTYIDTINGVMPLGTKFETLEFLKTLDYIKYAKCVDEEDNEYIWAYLQGHYDFKVKLEQLGNIAAKSNDAISKITNSSPKQWALENKHNPLARQRAHAWREYLTVNDCVNMIDYSYALTVHKSQGSTYNEVYLDNIDLKQILDKQMYLRLLYVGVSRAANAVYINN